MQVTSSNTKPCWRKYLPKSIRLRDHTLDSGKQLFTAAIVLVQIVRGVDIARCRYHQDWNLRKAFPHLLEELKAIHGNVHDVAGDKVELLPGVEQPECVYTAGHMTAFVAAVVV